MNLQKDFTHSHAEVRAVLVGFVAAVLAGLNIFDSVFVHTEEERSSVVEGVLVRDVTELSGGPS